MNELVRALNNTNVQAFLRVIRAGESSQTDSAYRMMFGGGLFVDTSKHPNVKVTRGQLTSTAAGAYQFLHSTWLECQKALGLPDFGEASQDLAAVYLIKRRGALEDVMAGRLSEAIKKCNREWASLPGSPYGQPTRTYAQAEATYLEYGGTLYVARTLDESLRHVQEQMRADIRSETPDSYRFPAGEAASSKHDQETSESVTYPAGEAASEGPMAPFIAAALPALLDIVPKLGSIFGSGSAVADRNVKAAEMVVDAAKQAIGAKNEQEMVERVKTDPAAAAAVKQAVESKWLEISEAGGGGIEGARKADAASAARGDMLHSPSFWVTLALLPLVYMIVGSVVGFWGKDWPSDVRAAIATAIVSLIVGGAAGYYWGQTTTRNRTKE